MRVATDVGGTFTDLVAHDPQSGALITAKAHSTPPDFARGTLNALARSGIDPKAVTSFIHGTTMVINAITERRGARVGLITTRGFRDVLEIARGNRPDLYNFAYTKPVPLVPRDLRLEVNERMGPDGQVLTPLNPEEVRAAARQLREAGAEAIAICFLHSYANPEHELRAAELVRDLFPDASVCASVTISREWREYERTSTAVLNAYVQPVGRAYLERLEAGLRAVGMEGAIYAMLSGGGIAPLERAAAAPIHLLESGPVAGMAGAALLGELTGRTELIALDVGGTTAKASLIQQGRVQVRTDYRVEATPVYPGYPVQVPVIDIVEVGAGGGSIAWVDPTGAARVGPRSAGADPGPVAYGKGGTEPTLADANLAAGRYNPENYLGGEVALDVAAARGALAHLAGRVGLDADAAALGVIRLGEAVMAKALRLVSLERGRDPRGFSLVAFGGTGPAHATALAAELRIPEVIIPRFPAVFSAWGMAMADLRLDRVRTLLLPLRATALERIHSAWSEMEAEARAELRREMGRSAAGGGRALRPVLHRQAALRYAGQEHTVVIPVPAGRWTAAHLARVADRFHKAHKQRYGFRLEAAIELVQLHLAAIVPGQSRTAGAWTGGGAPAGARKGSRNCLFTGGWQAVPVYDRDRLAAGAQLDGPALVEEAATVTVVLPGMRLRVDEWGNLIIRTGV